MELLNKELEKDGGGGGIVNSEPEYVEEVKKTKPKKEFLKKGKKIDELQKKEMENRMRNQGE